MNLINLKLKLKLNLIDIFFKKFYKNKEINHYYKKIETCKYLMKILKANNRLNEQKIQI